MFSGLLSQGAKHCFGGKSAGSSSLAMMRNAGMGLRASATSSSFMMMPMARRGFALLDPNSDREAIDPVTPVHKQDSVRLVDGVEHTADEGRSSLCYQRHPTPLAAERRDGGGKVKKGKGKDAATKKKGKQSW